MEVIIFPYNPTAVPEAQRFKIGNTYKDNQYKAVNWAEKTENPLEIPNDIIRKYVDIFSVKFNQQIINNYLTYKELIQSCSRNVDLPIQQIQPSRLSPRINQKSCNNIYTSQYLHEYKDILAMDDLVINNKGTVGEGPYVFVIVLLNKGQYYAHMYAWQSIIPELQRTYTLGSSLAMNPEYPLLIAERNYNRDASKALLEGLRYHSVQAQGKTSAENYIIFADPIPSIREYLHDLGFKQVFSSEDISGKPINGNFLIVESYYRRDNIKPFYKNLRAKTFYIIAANDAR